MKRLAAALAASLALAALGADPYAGYIYPAGLQVGTTNRFLIGGQGLWNVRRVYFDNPALRVIAVEAVPSFPNPGNEAQRRHIVKWLDGIAAGNPAEPPRPEDPAVVGEWRSNSWWNVLGSLDPGKIAIVERSFFTPRNALQSSPSLSQKMLVTVAADAGAKTGWCHFMVVTPAGISAPRPFEVCAARRTAEPLYVPPRPTRPKPEPASVDLRTGGAVLDGRIMPGETDVFRLRLAAKRHYAFVATARELQPYVGDAVPGFFNVALVLRDSKGAVVARADDLARFRPDPVLHFMPRAEGEFTLEVHDVLYRGRADFVYAVAVNAPGRRLFYPGVGYPARVRSAPPDGTVSGPDVVSRRTFLVDEPGPRILEVVARRRASPLDAVLTLRKSGGGPVLAQWDDATNKLFVGTIPQGECDPVGMYDFAAPGEYIAEVADRTGHGGNGYDWWLDVRKPKPGFDVYSTRSTLPLGRRAPLKVEFCIVRKDGFDGDVALEFPDGVHAAAPCVATAGVDRVSAKLVYRGRQAVAMRPVRLMASATIGGSVVRVPVTPCDEYEQAFAWKHLVPAANFVMNAPAAPPAGGGQRKPPPPAEGVKSAPRE
ncbi:MAG: hypothetical protein IKE55_06720 [Kiritimatiellae bacterium]|nr:hypothetical protein [Kiritimatiellia bacterium]